MSQYKSVGSKRYWRWCITLEVTGFLDFAHRLVLRRTQRFGKWFRGSGTSRVGVFHPLSWERKHCALLNTGWWEKSKNSIIPSICWYVFSSAPISYSGGARVQISAQTLAVLMCFSSMLRYYRILDHSRFLPAPFNSLLSSIGSVEALQYEELKTSCHMRHPNVVWFSCSHFPGFYCGVGLRWVPCPVSYTGYPESSLS
jgi:hypothetical protein